MQMVFILGVFILLRVGIRVRDFRLHNAISLVFTIYSLAATCFGRTVSSGGNIYTVENNSTDMGSIIFLEYLLSL
jgi:hypothetical protein